MDFKQIDAFVNVAKYKSFSKAAEAIYLSQPTVSAHIASLEESLNVSLFDRNGKDIRLTHAGTIFLEYAINLINLRNTAILSISQIDKNIFGKLTIACSTTPCRFLLPSLVKSYHDIYKEVSFDIKEGSTKKVIEMILSGAGDIGIVGEQTRDPRLSYEKICDDKLVIISNSKTLNDNLTLEELFKENFIQRESGSATRNIFDSTLKANGYNASSLNILAEVSSLEAILQFVKSGAGISIASEIACNDYIQTGLLKKHNLEGINIIRGIYVVSHIKRTLTPSAKAFLNHILKNKKISVTH